jgi:ligand-binding sensor protein
MKLINLLPFETWKAFEDDLHNRSGLEANVFDTDGIRITDNKRWVNKVCPAVKADDRGQSFICAVAHMNLATQARRTREPVIAECDAGLLKMVVPIFKDDAFVGAVGACGLLLDDAEVDSFMINRTIGMAEEEIEALAEGIGSITTARAEALAAYIVQRIEIVLEGGQ